MLVLAFPTCPQHQAPTGCVFTGVGALPSPWGATPLLFHPTFNLGMIILLLPALSCPANSNYSLCTNLCVNSCTGLVDSSKCPKTCAEGCHCNKGFIFDGHGCVPEDKCGCFVDGKYYKVVMSRVWMGLGDFFFLTFSSCLRCSTLLQRRRAHGPKQEKKPQNKTKQPTLKIFRLPSDSVVSREENWSISISFITWHKGASTDVDTQIVAMLSTPEGAK